MQKNKKYDKIILEGLKQKKGGYVVKT